MADQLEGIPERTTVSYFLSPAIGRSRGCDPTLDVLILGHEVLLPPGPLLPTPPWTKSPPTHNGQHTYSFRPARDSELTLAQVVSNFSRDLRQRHRTKVYPPPPTTNQSIVDTLVSPVLHLLSQLRAPVIKHPLQSASTDFGDGTIQSVYPPILDSLPVTAETPVLIFLPSDTLGHREEAAAKLSQFSELFRNTWNGSSRSKIVLTDLSSLFILQLSTTESDVAIYERLPLLDRALIAARVAIAAYIYDALPVNAYLTYPRATKAYDPPTVYGCLRDPSIPILPDEEVFSTYKCHRDFDLYTLMNSPPLALQFLRWKAYMKERAAKIQTLRSGDILPAFTGRFAQENALLTPCWPVDVDSIPQETMECIRQVARPHAFDEDKRARLSASETFDLRLREQLAASREPRGATVYRCEIVSTDGKAVLPTLSNLCVKLFDDRLLVMYPPEEPNEQTVGPDAGWWRGWSTSEDCVRNEHVAYQQLSFAQGSLVPWYYGAHKFVLPDGHCLYGILLEFVPGGRTIDDLPAMNEENRIQLIRNARHALRAMQYADISQHDFHSGQLIMLHAPVPHVVLLDFASASTSVEPELHAGHDYANMLNVLSDTGRKGKDGRREKDATVLLHFGEREAWDFTRNSYPDGKGGWRALSAPDPFAWVWNGSAVQ